MNIRLLDTGLRDGAENMALDGIILEEVEAGHSPPTFRFLRFDPPVALVGFNQDILTEIRAEFCRANGIDINRRQTGGGAILFEPEMLGFELFWPLDRPGFGGGFGGITARLASLGAEALSRLGTEASFRPRNDIEINGRKVSGTGMAFLSRAWMFQGTVLVENCLELMLRALKIPLEKLKRREIQSLLQRVTFLADELGRTPAMEEIKEAFVEAFSRGLGMDLVPAGLTAREKARLAEEKPYYNSEEWIHRQRIRGPGSEMLRAQAGRLNVALWADLKRRSIKQALITGDFFARPNRLVMDLEGYLRGASIKPDKLREAIDGFFADDPGELISTTREELTETILQAAQKGSAPWPGFDVLELNHIQPIALDLNLEGWTRPNHFLLPYCAKDLDCPLRHEDKCVECGLCEIGEMYALADRYGLKPVTITSFEHLMEVLEGLGRETYIASCCPAFLAKHQHEMEAAGPKGIIVDVNSLTCYDLGKETDAYHGQYENKSELMVDLLAKVIDFLAGEKAPGQEAA